MPLSFHLLPHYLFSFKITLLDTWFIYCNFCSFDLCVHFASGNCICFSTSSDLLLNYIPPSWLFILNINLYQSYCGSILVTGIFTFNNTVEIVGEFFVSFYTHSCTFCFGIFKFFIFFLTGIVLLGSSGSLWIHVNPVWASWVLCLEKFLFCFVVFCFCVLILLNSMNLKT